MRRIIWEATPKNCARFCQHHEVLPDETQIGLMDQRGRLQRVSDPLAPQMRGRASPQLLIHHSHQPVARLDVSPVPSLQQSAHIRVRVLPGVHDLIV